MAVASWGVGFGCGGDEEPGSQAVDADAGLSDIVGDGSAPGDADSAASAALFEHISGERWDETAVRQVLHVFAFGGFASDAQISAWAEMAPEEAIVELLSFEPTNARLAPRPEGAPPLPGTLWELAERLSSDDADNPLPADIREDYALGAWSAPESLWFFASLRTGLNPVRQRIGLFETNTHLAVNQDVGVNNWQILHYYDEIMEGLADGAPYRRVLSRAALSAAVATQYGHRYNRFVDAHFEGNEDFAREFHQLFFGILGLDDPAYHEHTSIRNTAKALTDMRIERVPDGEGDERDSELVTFGTDEHYPAPLEILHAEIAGETAEEKIEALADVAVAHPESLDALPLLIVRGLADDELDDEERAALRAAWAAMGDKDLLRFLREYAISTTFHSPHRVKRWTSVERNLLLHNLITLTPEAALAGYYDPRWWIHREGVRVFRPLHNVFGGQTGLDAAGNGEVFRQAYNHSTREVWTLAKADVEDDQGEVIWHKNWAAVVPRGPDGKWRVKGVAEWLWRRFIADGLDHFGPLERAYVYAYIGAGEDFGVFVDSNNADAVYSSAEISERPDLRELVSDMEIAVLALDSDDPDIYWRNGFRLGLAINFIAATPYAFAQQGR